MRLCDPDWCLYASPAIELDSCDAKVCREHDAAAITEWNDGVDSGWLHVRGTCGECDRCWADVDANTAYYAEQGLTSSLESAPVLIARQAAEPSHKTTCTSAQPSSEGSSRG